MESVYFSETMVSTALKMESVCFFKTLVSIALKMEEVCLSETLVSTAFKMEILCFSETSAATYESPPLSVFMWLWIQSVPISSGLGNGPSNSVEGGSLLDQLSDCQMDV
jgi:hypothetical protein